MVNLDIVKYFLEGRQRGFDIGFLKRQLLQAGFRPNDIYEAIGYIQALDQQTIFQMTQQKNPNQQIPQSQNSNEIKENIQENKIEKQKEPIEKNEQIKQQSLQVTSNQLIEKKIENIQKEETKSQDNVKNEKSVAEDKTYENLSSKEKKEETKNDEKQEEAKKEDIGKQKEDSNLEFQKKQLEEKQQKFLVEESIRLGIFKKIAYSLISPRKLFQNTRSEGFGRTIEYWYVLTVIPSIILALSFALLIQQNILIIAPYTLGLGGVLSVLIKIVEAGFLFLFGFLFVVSLLTFYIFGAISTIFQSFLFHLFIKLYGGEGNFLSTYKAYVYSFTPLLLLGPLFSFSLLSGTMGFFVFLSCITVISIWSFIVLIKGLSINHAISKTRSFFALISVGLIYVLIGLIISLIFLMAGIGSEQVVYQGGNYGE